MAISDLRRRVLAGALLIAAVFTVLQAVDYRQDVPSNDTYQYAKQTLRFLGDDPRAAIHGAVVMFCQDTGNAASTADTLDYGASSGSSSYRSAYGTCLDKYRNGLTPDSPRYLAIFTSRPGYPLLAAPIAAVFGLRFGLWAAALLCTLLASALVLVLLRSVGCPPGIALAGQALYLAAPTGYWGSRMLTDGPSLAATLLTLVGAWWLVRGRTGPGLWLFGAGLVTGFLVRYSSEQVLALFVALAGAVCLLRVPGARTRRIRLLTLAAGAGFAACEIASTALGWPGLSASLQDTFTRHFVRPDVSDPVGRLVRLDRRFWTDYPVSEPTALLLLAGLVTVAVLLIRRERVYGILVAATALTGVAAVAAHPLATQSDRLMVPAWLLLVLGLPPLLRSRRAVGPDSPESAPVPSEPRPALAAGSA